MAWFPFFMDLTGMEGLIVGGGEVALRKAEKLLPYGARLTICACEMTPEFMAFSDLTLREEPFTPRRLEGVDYVIAATDDRELNHKISALCQERGIPVNVVDDRAYCTFLFPALVKRGELSVGISTGGASPTGAVYVKERINAVLPERFEEILAFLDAARPQVKTEVPEECRRAAVFKELFSACMERGGPIEERELQKLLEENGKEGERNG